MHHHTTPHFTIYHHTTPFICRHTSPHLISPHYTTPHLISPHLISLHHSTPHCSSHSNPQPTKRPAPVILQPLNWMLIACPVVCSPLRTTVSNALTAIIFPFISAGAKCVRLKVSRWETITPSQVSTFVPTIVVGLMVVVVVVMMVVVMVVLGVVVPALTIFCPSRSSFSHRKTFF